MNSGSMARGSTRYLLLALIVVLLHVSLTVAAPIRIAAPIYYNRDMVVSWETGRLIKEAIEERSNGEIIVTLLGPEVGGERDMLEGVTAGEYQLMLGGSLFISAYLPEYSLLGGAYLFPSFEHFDQAYEIMEEPMNDALAEKGKMRVVDKWVRGPRYISSKKPIYNADDYRGLRIRVPESISWILPYKALETVASPIPYAEIFTALQTGVVEAQGSPASHMLESKLYEVQKYIVRVLEETPYNFWLINDDFYQSLSPEHRDIVISSIEEAVAWASVEEPKVVTESLIKLQRDFGMIVIEPDVDSIFEKARVAHQDYVANNPIAPALAEYLETVLWK